MADDDLELMLVDETGDAQEEVQPVAGAGESDDDVVLIEEDETVFTEEFSENFREAIANAEKFFAPDSPNSVANLSPEVRTATAKYAAALFEWICCLPSPDSLHSELPNFADIELPFPITPDRKRVLIRREFGARLADVWRQSKSADKMASQYKLHWGVAVMSLLDYGFATPSFEMDVLPLLQWQCIDQVDYHVIASFVLAHCSPRDWQEPEEFFLETLVTPLIAAIGLYMLSADCVRGRAAEIPWKTMERQLKDMSAAELQEFDATLLEAHKEMRENDPVTKVMEEKERILRELQTQSAVIRSEEQKLRAQMKMDRQTLDELSAKYTAMNLEKKRHIQHIRPANFDQTGAQLAQADDEIDILDVRPSPNFEKLNLSRADLVLQKGAAVLARRKLDAPEKFEPAVFMDMDETDSTRALICFDSEPTTSVAVPLLNIALATPVKGRMPVMSEGVRVAARVRHPLAPAGPHAIYSGTIISKYDVTHQDYSVIFDDFFDEYAHIDEMWLMAEQSFDTLDAFDSRSAYTLMTASEALPEPSEERRVFLLCYFYKYPDWSLVKMADRMGSNMSCFHRDGMGWVSKVLAVDRHMVWLRFNKNSTTGFDSEQSCMAHPCTKHQHLDEKMYRGNPRLKSARTQTNFDKALETYRAHNDNADNKNSLQLALLQDLSQIPQSRQQLRRQHRRQQAAGVGFEAAVPVVPKKRGEGGAQFTQTARKCGTGLQSESAVPGAEIVRKRKEAEVVILHHQTEKKDYAPEEYHDTCSHECLKGLDKDAFHDDFKRDYVSPYYIPIKCGWRRVKEYYSFGGKGRNEQSCIVHYRAPCGRTIDRIEEVITYLKQTRSELNMDSFTFSPDVDETAYVQVKKESIVCADLTNGHEARPIPVANELDKEEYTDLFNYRGRRYPLNNEVKLQTMTKDFCSGCDCTDDCSDWTKCACQRLTHRESVRATHTYPNVTKGYTNRLLRDRVQTGIYECNENCGCSRKRCTNRVVQNEINVPMVMYKTDGMGWGVRSLCDIPKGAFISCYQGAMLSDEIGEINGEGDEYYADLDFYNLVENDKQNSGVDETADHGIFVDDVGTRELSAEEVREAQPVGELELFRREFEQLMRKGKREIQKQQPKKRGRKPKLANEERGPVGGAEGPDTEGSADEGMEDDGHLMPSATDDDEEMDEGVEEGDSCGSRDEKSSSTDEEKKREEEEERGRTRSEQRRIEAEKEEKRREEQHRRMRKAMEEREAAAARYTIPLIDGTGTYQLDSYFSLAHCDHLFLIDAKSAGNIGRQYNHSCEPNMFTNHIFVDTHDIRLPWVAFFAKRAIKAGEELTWDYGWHPNPDFPRGLKCLCNTPGCRIDLL